MLLYFCDFVKMDAIMLSDVFVSSSSQVINFIFFNESETCPTLDEVSLNSLPRLCDFEWNPAVLSFPSFMDFYKSFSFSYQYKAYF